ncbi:MAG: hypothetical protein BGO82_16645 [Devosia sp. 67-54]|uniref:DUF4153 domain-containing protein n=1 Tax=unclassified Devosia TaxID=196773 RepID=UPI000966FC74|nr:MULTISPECIES: DUF4173 domain-containing protein [unclassified Devosia]MBN9304004.1 DUF4173 domain-containing protein [Devosia sp.]OJX17846.1 MAG: hypothetical protein BGO82_16645 [Devosia sp. 67-54]
MTDQSLNSVAAEDQRPSQLPWSRRAATASLALAVLIAAGDLLFFRHEPGISLAVFFLALTAAVAALHRQALRRPRAVVLLGVAVLAALPFAEFENLLWVPFALGAVSLLALELGGHLGRFEDWLGPVLRFALLSPVRGLTDGAAVLGAAGRQRLGGRLARLALVWIVPVACAAVFAFLFVAANPVLEDVLHAVRLAALLDWLDPLRVFIWCVVAAAAWPVLLPRLLPWRLGGAWQGPLQPQPESLVFGTAAIRNSLLVFNALFAVQTAMDLLFLWGGVRLPDGLSYADYAHRGAYPLIATAILAGAFVLLAMRRGGPGEKSPLIRTLVYLWVAQNVWLVVSSLLRLDLYVEAYGLTEMRIAAGVWMGLVAVGLVLIVGKIAAGRSNRWLVMANLAVLMLALWGVAFIDVPALIARFNVEHSREVAGSGPAVDTYYLAGQGAGAIPAFDQFLRTAKFAAPETLASAAKMRTMLADRLRQRDAEAPPVWQSWTWRDTRVRAYLATQPFAPDAAAAKN